MRPITTAALALGLACVAGCVRESSGASSEVLRILAEHRLAGVEPNGQWRRFGPEDAWIMIVRQQASGRWELRRMLLSSKAQDRTTPVPANTSTTSGDLANGILSLDSPLDGSTRFHLCRFGREEFLLPEDAVRFRDPSVPHPEGVVYERFGEGEVDETLSGRSVVEELPAGTWEAVDCPEWAWLEIQPTGAPGAYRLRCSRRRGDEPTPVNSYSRGTWKADALALDAMLFGNASWCVRHSAGEDWLVPVATIRADVVPEPEGMRFRLASRASRNKGQIWGGVDFPDWNEDY